VAREHADLALHVVEIDLPPSEAHVGAARRLAMDEAYRRLVSVGRPGGLIATTDADTLVSPTWVAATLREVELGAEAVGGRILVAAPERQVMASPVRSRFLRNVGYFALANEVATRIDPYPGDPWPCHEQFFGASLAITARAYRAVGGLPVLSSGEDAALSQALRRADIEVRHSLAVRVQTSGRLDGRTPAGLAALLASWSSLTSDDQLQLVPGAATVVARATCRRSLRDLWKQAGTSRDVCASEVAHLAALAGVPETWLHQVLLRPGPFGMLLEEVVERAGWQRDPDLVDVRKAIEDLRAWLEPYRRRAASPPIFARHLQGLPFLLPSRRPGHAGRPTGETSSLAALEQVEAVRPLTPPSQVA
jgi:hypothetical protein